MIRGKRLIVALLGRRDEPTDALKDYCLLLREALGKSGRSLHLTRMPWADIGWLRALRWLWKESAGWTGQWVLVQYTALSWSRRGFPLGFPAVIGLLKRRRARVAIVFHDPVPFGGSRLRDRARRNLQVAAMRWTARAADRLVSTVSPGRIPWMQDGKVNAKVRHIPVGSNVMSRSEETSKSQEEIPTVIVFGVTENKRDEAEGIAQVTRLAREAVGPLRLVVFGRGAFQAEPTLRPLLEGSQVALEVYGVLAAEEAEKLLASADVQLFVRAGVSTRRGTAIAGICCGLPIVGYAGEETTSPMTEAGVCLSPFGDVQGCARELIAVLKDGTLRESLRGRSREAAKRYFSWDVIAGRFLEVLS